MREERLSPLAILLDPRNPRLSDAEQESSQNDLIRIMLRSFRIEELAESILASGYLPFDPLVGYQDGESIVVREGNRRITALKLLLDPSLAHDTVRAQWERLSAELSEKYRQEIEEVAIQVFDAADEIDLSSYIGFRHVTGVLKWPALEKASFIAQLVKDGRDYQRIAKRLGSYAKHIERHYVAFQVVTQAEDAGLDGASQMQNRFGVLLRALQVPGIRGFIGVDYPDDAEASSTPVPAERMDQLAELVRWTFGTDQVSPIVTDSRQLTKWGQILEEAEAVAYLRRTPQPTFERAWFRSGGQALSVAQALLAASDQIQETVPLVSEYTEDDDVANGVAQCARFFRQVLAHFPDIGKRYGLAAE